MTMSMISITMCSPFTILSCDCLKYKRNENNYKVVHLHPFDLVRGDIKIDLCGKNDSIDINMIILAIIHVVIFERGWPLTADPPFSSATYTKCKTGTNNSSSQKGLTKMGSQTNTNIVQKNVLFCILSPVPLLPDCVDIPSTQHRSSEGSRSFKKRKTLTPK